MNQQLLYATQSTAIFHFISKLALHFLNKTDSYFSNEGKFTSPFLAAPLMSRGTKNHDAETLKAGPQSDHGHSSAVMWYPLQKIVYESRDA